MGHHPGDIAAQTVNTGGSMSPLTWMILIAVLAGSAYFVYWILFQDKKKR